MTIALDNDQFKAVLNDAFDWIITNWGTDCKIKFPPLYEDCNNCILSVSGRPTSHYREGGPIPFSDLTACPLCNSSGKREIDTSKTIRVRIAWNPKDFWVPISNVVVPQGVIQTRGYIANLTDVLNASELIPQNVPNYLNPRYKRFMHAETPYSIVQDKYFVVMWERA